MYPTVADLMADQRVSDRRVCRVIRCLVDACRKGQMDRADDLLGAVKKHRPGLLNFAADTLLLTHPSSQFRKQGRLKGASDARSDERGIHVWRLRCGESD